jgi:integrase
VRRRKGGHIFTREQGKASRYYGDFRHVGGGREALVAPGENLATTDPAIAEALYGQRLAAYQRATLRHVHGLPPETPLLVYARDHLIAKKRAGKVTERWIGVQEHFLNCAVEHFGADRELSNITAKDVDGWAAQLASLPARRRKHALSRGSVRHYLNALSNLYGRAQADGVVVPGYNPVAAMLDKPRAAKREAHWLEVPDAALLLEAARIYRPTRSDLAIPFTYPLVATLLLTGGRLAEVLGLEVDDVSLDRETVTFRVNAWRRLKTEGSFRTVRLWPQLAEILRSYFPERERMGQGTLLFPSLRTGEERMLRDIHRVLDAVAERAGWKAGEIRSKMFRHTYTAARLQTLDQGEAVSVYTVSKELGHGGEALVRTVYGHLGTVRHRSEAVEYRVKQHRKVLKERLERLNLSLPLALLPNAAA